NGGGGGGGSGGGSGGGRQSSARRPGSLALGSQQQQQQQQQNHHLISAGSSGRSLPSTPNGFQQQQQQHQVHMSAAEYKAVMFVRKVLLKKGGRMPLAKLFTVLSRPGDGAEQARNLIGWTQMELEEFLAKRPLFFDCCSSLVSDSAEVAVRRGQRLSIVISESATTAAAASAAAAAAAPTPAQSVNGGEAPRTLSNRCGTVFHCSRLWGIIDLGRHEHVFFDRSIFKHVEDLQRHFKVNDPVYFNAILAPRESRAKWRATKVWKECDRPLVDRMSAAAAAASIVSPLSPSPSPAAPTPSAAVGGITGASSAEAEAQAAEAELCRLLDSLLVGPSPSLSSPVASTPSVGSSGRLC
uniref:CULLIN_2 domain-containing protein n=1 Tax=Macrostomum lignano TaxID=282301 RepID=A0A1I8I108_9PLAT